jgi:hypothetical protein
LWRLSKLPKSEQKKPHRQTPAREMAAERGGILMLVEIAMRQALACGKRKMAPRRKRAKVYRIIR